MDHHSSSILKLGSYREKNKEISTEKGTKWKPRDGLDHSCASVFLFKADIHIEVKDFSNRDSNWDEEKTKTKAFLWAKVRTRKRMNSLWRAIQYMNLLCLCLSSFLRLCTESRAVADGLFQKTTRPKGLPLCCAFSIQTTKAVVSTPLWNGLK